MNNQSPVANVIVDQSEMSEYHEPKGFDFKFLRDARERKQQSKVPKIQNVTIKSLMKHTASKEELHRALTV